MEHVTHKTAIALKAAGFPQPLPKLAQLWYFHSGDNAIVLWPKPEYGGLNLVISTMGGSIYAGDKFNEIAVFAPTAVELLESLPPKTLAGFNNGEWSVTPAGTEMVFTHRNLSEAAAMAWMALNKNNASVETCQTCHIKPATEMHTCPYATEINDCDNECNCCDGCRHECVQSI